MALRPLVPSWVLGWLLYVTAFLPVFEAPDWLAAFALDRPLQPWLYLAWASVVFAALFWSERRENKPWIKTVKLGSIRPVSTRRYLVMTVGNGGEGGSFQADYTLEGTDCEDVVGRRFQAEWVVKGSFEDYAQEIGSEQDLAIVGNDTAQICLAQFYTPDDMISECLHIHFRAMKLGKVIEAKHIVLNRTDPREASCEMVLTIRTIPSMVGGEWSRRYRFDQRAVSRITPSGTRIAELSWPAGDA